MQESNCSWERHSLQAQMCITLDIVLQICCNIDYFLQDSEFAADRQMGDNHRTMSFS